MLLRLAALAALAAVAAAAWNNKCVKEPVGFGRLTKGGDGGRKVRPKDVNELKTLLSSNEKLVIDLWKEYDFTDTEGWATNKGCYYRKCGNGGFQESLARFGICNGRAATQVKFAKAGTTELVVSSFKTIMSTNGKGKIKGKGLRIKKAKEVKIIGITISDINPEVIWGGDALVLDNAENVWIHQNTIARIGRQHLVAHQSVNKGITVSSNFFDGTTTHSASCDGTHYWMFLFWGTHDEVTLINNRIYRAAARCPHAGGWAGANNFIHMVGNFIDNDPHNGIEPNSGAFILAEGNVFSHVKRMVNRIAKGGHLALVDNAGNANTCKKYFGQACKINSYPGTRSEKRFEESVLQAFAKLDKVAINGARAAVCVS